jgi:hypothetical protein
MFALNALFCAMGEIRVKTAYRLIIACWLLVAGYTFSLRNWEHPERILYWDILSYYAYLPATFIHGDLSLQYTREAPEKNRIRYWPSEGPEGSLVIKTSMGMAFMYAPFFFLGHATAMLSGAEAEGFGTPYRLWLIIGSLVYLLAGGLLLFRYLIRFFSAGISLLTLALIFFGTNLFYYAVGECTMPHVYNFFLITAFLLLLDHQWRSRKWVGWPLGLLLGYIALVRPTNLWVGILIPFYGVSHPADFRARMRTLLAPRFILFFVMAALAAWAPQMAYWKYVTRQWLYFSYSGERFFFDQPHIWEGLFGFRKGWLIYTPLMLFALAGLIPLWRHRHPLGKVLPVFLAVQVYVMLSWWSWWYGGGFGMRPMVDVYGLLAVPLGALLFYTQGKRPLLMGIPAGLMLVFAVYLNQFQIWQYQQAVIHWDSMTYKAYKHVFLSRSRDGVDPYLQSPDYDKAREGRE